MEFDTRIMEWIDQQSWLQDTGKTIQAAVHRVYETGGGAGLKVRDFFHGTWLGHPLHPVLTDVPIGAWTASQVLDTLEMVTGNEAFGVGADAAIGLGLAGAAGSVVAGLTDYEHLAGRSRQVGLLHGLLNLTATGFYIASLVARRQRDRRAGMGLALTGYLIAATSAYLGGDLVYNEKIGVDHAPEPAFMPKKFTAAMDADDLPEGEMRRVDVENIPILLVRRGKQIYAIAETCSHLGGPLAEGELREDNSVVCPWHGSRFSMEDGRMLNGPSTYNQPCLETRIYNGKIEVRVPPAS